MEGTRLKTLHGVAIYVRQDGKFTAELGKMLVQRSRLVDLERLIDQSIAGVECMVLQDNAISTPQLAVIVGVESDGRFRDRDRSIYPKWGPKVYLMDENALIQLRQLEHERLALVRKWISVVSGLTLLTPEHIANAPVEVPGE